METKQLLVIILTAVILLLIVIKYYNNKSSVAQKKINENRRIKEEPSTSKEVNKEPVMIYKDGEKIKETKFFPDGGMSVQDFDSCKFFNASGVLEREYWREDGKSSFEWNGGLMSSREYNDNGILKKSSTHSPTGVFESFNTNGSIDQYFDEKGLPVSISFANHTFFYDDNGSIINEFNFSDDGDLHKLVIVKSEYESYYIDDENEDNSLIEIEYILRWDEFEYGEWHNFDNNFGDIFLRFYFDDEKGISGTDFSKIRMASAFYEDSYEIDELDTLLQEDIRKYGLTNCIDFKEIKKTVNESISRFNYLMSFEAGKKYNDKIVEFLNTFLNSDKSSST
tara:strand:+ start:828 stop:1841 length:1014 start_codon:yes stop_codon:yes gene_type:complete